MPLYFFDVQNSGATKDDTGTECASLAEVRKEAMKFLPKLVADEMPDGDRRIFSLVVRNDNGRPVFAVTMAVIGMWLDQEKPNAA